MDKVLVEYSSSNGIFVQHRLLDREYFVKTASHAHYEFVYLLNGKMELDVEGQKREVQAGELILIDANVLHSQRMLGGTETELIVLSFMPSVLPSIVKYGFIRIIADSPILMHALPKDIVEKYNILEYFKQICVYAKNQELQFKDLYISSELVKLVAVLSEAVDGIIKVESVSAVKANKTVIISKCLDYLNSNLTKKIGIEQIAENLCCSKSYLQHVFKKEMGLSISEYINTQKMSIARSLLCSNVTPSDVADKLGYEYYSTFSAKFKKYFGVAPKAIQTETMMIDVDYEKYK